jgi:hypothetical protein
MREKLDESTPAIFLGGSRHGDLTDCRHGEAFRSEDDSY